LDSDLTTPGASSRRLQLIFSAAATSIVARSSDAIRSQIFFSIMDLIETKPKRVSNQNFKLADLIKSVFIKSSTIR
jgi:hypothetical protein